MAKADQYFSEVRIFISCVGSGSLQIDFEHPTTLGAHRVYAVSPQTRAGRGGDTSGVEHSPECVYGTTDVV